MTNNRVSSGKQAAITRVWFFIWALDPSSVLYLQHKLCSYLGGTGYWRGLFLRFETPVARWARQLA
jgi:hypothetical protein